MLYLQITFSSIIYIGWGFYLLLCSSLLFMLSNVFIIKNISNLSKNKMRTLLYKKDTIMFILSIWLLIILNIIIFIYMNMTITVN